MYKALQRLRSGAWMTTPRLLAGARILLLCEVSGLVFCIAGTHGLLVRMPHPTSTDFVSFYAAGHLADSGTASLAYDHAAHYAAEQQATEPGISYNYFYYPPVFLLLCATFARLPYLGAFVAFQAASLLSCLLAVRGVLRDSKMVFLLAFPAVVWTIGTGQNALLTAALFAAATLQIDRRPILAGMLFGALCYKPHFGLLIPIALAAGGYGRAFAAAGATVLALIGFSGWVFGWQSWTAFLQAMAGSQSVYAGHAIDLVGLASPYGAMLVLGQSVWWAEVVQAIVTLGVAGLVAVVWRRGLSLPVRAAVLLAAIPVATPIVMFYDLMLSGVAIAWLVRAGQTNGFSPWSKTLLAVAFILPLLTGNVAGANNWLLAPATALLVLGLAAAAARREFAGRRETAPAAPAAGAAAILG